MTIKDDLWPGLHRKRPWPLRVEGNSGMFHLNRTAVEMSGGLKHCDPANLKDKAQFFLVFLYSFFYLNATGLWFSDKSSFIK